MTGGIPFRKMNGLGNDFVVLDARARPVSIDPDKARAIADRNTGVGCDQLIVIEPSSIADVRMRIWNNEGFEVESCGNASRCIADLLFREKATSRATIDTLGGFLTCVKSANGLVTVDVTDNDSSKAKASGILALQLHAGPPMTVQFKDIQYKELK